MKFNNFFIGTNILTKHHKKIPDNSMFFDIETTGLSAMRSHVYLIGCAYQTEIAGTRKWLLRQFFLDRPAGERDLLAAFADCIRQKSVRTLIHYNGSTFDIPYLTRKYNFYGMPNPLESFQSDRSIDLYRSIRPFRKVLGADALKQKDIEKLLGICRRDRFSGKELITAYQDYLQSGNPDLLEAMYLHNREDVANMLPIYSLTGIVSFFGGDFSVTSCGTDPASGDFSAVLRPKFTSPVPIHAHNDFCSLNWTGENAGLTVRPFRGTLKHFFPDYRSYYYLPEEDQAIHKSVGAFVDPSHREPAKAANCYSKKSGTFLPQPRERITPVFRNDYRSGYSYFLFDPDRIPEKNLAGNVPVSAYITDLLESLIS